MIFRTNVLIESIDIAEHKRFERWLNWKLGKRQPYIIPLFRAYKKAVEASDIWELIYPEKPFDNARFRFMSNQLSDLLEQYIATLSFEADEYAQQLYLLKGLNHHSGTKGFKSSVHKIQRRMEKRKERDAPFFRAMYQIEGEYQQFVLKHREYRNDSSFTSLNSYYLHAWMLEGIYLGIGNLNSGLVSGDKELPDWLRNMIHLMQEIQLTEPNPVFDIYVELFQLLEGKKEDISPIVNQVQERPYLIGDASSISNICFLIINFLVRQSRKDKNVQLNERLLNFYVWTIEEKYLLVDGKLLSSHYTNLIVLGLRLKKFKLVWEYLHSFKKFLPKQEAEDMYTYNLATYHFARKNFSDAAKLFHRAYKQSLVNLQARIMNVQARYELGAREELSHTLRQLRKTLINTRKMGAARKQALLNRLACIQDLRKCYFKEDFIALQEKLRQTSPISGLEWLKEKCEENLQKVAPAK